MTRGHLLETRHMLAASPQQIGRAFRKPVYPVYTGQVSGPAVSAQSPPPIIRPCLPLDKHTRPRIHPSVPRTGDVGSARPAGAGQAVRETWSASRSWPGLLNTSGCMCAAFWLMTSALPAAASSRASKNAPAMRRARQLGIDNICNIIINAQARATTIESAIGHSDVAHANTGNTEDISRNCISPPSRGGMAATFGASGRISHSVSSMATSHSSPRAVLANYGKQITRSLSLCCGHVWGQTSCNRWPATAR